MPRDHPGNIGHEIGEFQAVQFLGEFLGAPRAAVRSGSGRSVKPQVEGAAVSGAGHGSPWYFHSSVRRFSGAVNGPIP